LYLTQYDTDDFSCVPETRSTRSELFLDKCCNQAITLRTGCGVVTSQNLGGYVFSSASMPISERPRKRRRGPRLCQFRMLRSGQVSSRPCCKDKQPRARFHPESTEAAETSFALFRSSCADPCSALCTEPRFDCCKQAKSGQRDRISASWLRTRRSGVRISQGAPFFSGTSLRTRTSVLRSADPVLLIPLEVRSEKGNHRRRSLYEAVVLRP